MNDSTSRTTATIYDFSTGNRIATTGSRKVALIEEQAEWSMASTGWYHESAIADDAGRKH